MAQTDMIFENVAVTKMGSAKSTDDSLFTVKIRRVSDEAQVTILKSKDDVDMKITMTGTTEACKVGTAKFVINIQGDHSIVLKFSTAAEMKRFQAQVDFRSKCQSVFDKRTAESSAVQYFQFYGYLSQQQNMMQDYVRTGTYQKAMVQNFVDFRDKVVLDVGAGSGILSFFAMQAGARKVYAVEASTMAEHTKKLVSCSQYAGRIIVIPGKIEEIEIPEQVDIIVSEPMGYMLFNERMLETYLHSKKFLRPNGLMFPTIGDLHIAPFSDELLYMEQFTKANFWYQQSFHGVDLSPLRDAAVEEYFKQPIVDTFDIRILMSKSVKYTVNFLQAQEEDLHRIEIPLHFTAHSSGTVHGFAFWFDIAFIGTINTVWLSTAPTESLTHWYQVRCLFRSPLFIKAGETMVGKVVLRSNMRQSYDVDIEAVVESTGCKAENTLDLKNPFFHYTGQPPATPAGAHTSSPSEAHCSGVASDGYTSGAGINTTNSQGQQQSSGGQYASGRHHQSTGGSYQDIQQQYPPNVYPSQYHQQNGTHASAVGAGAGAHGAGAAGISAKEQANQRTSGVGAGTHGAQQRTQQQQQNGGNMNTGAFCNTVPLLAGGITYSGLPNKQSVVSGGQQQPAGHQSGPPSGHQPVPPPQPNNGGGTGASAAAGPNIFY